MQFIEEPSVLHLASTQVDTDSLQEMLQLLGAPQWRTQAQDQASLLVEVAGRLCYKSFGTDLNPNITKVREGNLEYVDNILKQKHGAVIEHGTATYAILNCSRVVTHEFVRHRIASYSQESLRYVRLTDLKAYFPDAFNKHPKSSTIRQMFVEVFSYLEKVQQDLSDVLDLDSPGLGFEVKKALTSAMRRMAPIGLATNIVVTANHRSWRNIIMQRTSRHAEEEIRLVAYKIAQDLSKRCYGIYQDIEFVSVPSSEIPEVTFKHGDV